MSRRTDAEIESVARAANKGAEVLRRAYQSDPEVFDVDLRAAESFLRAAYTRAVDELRRRAEAGRRSSAARDEAWLAEASQAAGDWIRREGERRWPR